MDAFKEAFMMMGDMDEFVPTYEEVAAFFESVEITTFTDDVYNYLLNDFAPYDDRTTVDTLMQMLQVPSSDAEDLLMAMEEWMFEMMMGDMDDMHYMPTYDEVRTFLEG